MARAPYGSKLKRIPGLEVSIGKGLERIGADVQSRFQELDDSIKYQFDLLVKDWTGVFLGACKASIKNSMWLRSQRLYKDVTVKSTSYKASGEHSVEHIVSAIVPEGAGEDNYAYGLTQEFHRASAVSGAGGGKGETYLVPLASWVRAHGLSGGGDKKYMTKAQIERDLAQPGVFFPKKIFRTKAGPARMFLVYKEGKYPKLTRDSKGRKLTRGQLKKVATAMYLAYKGYTGIYGASSGQKKTPRVSRAPLAAQFGLTSSNKSPAWFTRAAANSLGALQRAVNRVRVTYEATDIAFRLGGETGGEEEGTKFSFGDQSIRDYSYDIFEDVSNNLDEETKEPSEYEKKHGFR